LRSKPNGIHGLRNSAHKQWDALGDFAELVEPEAKNREDFIEDALSGEFDGAVVAYRTFASVDITGRFDKELISVLPASLKFICHNGRRSLRFLTRDVRLSYASSGKSYLTGALDEIPAYRLCLRCNLHIQKKKFSPGIYS
jgi:hypothetical protein